MVVEIRKCLFYLLLTCLTQDYLSPISLAYFVRGVPHPRASCHRILALRPVYTLNSPIWGFPADVRTFLLCENVKCMNGMLAMWGICYSVFAKFFQVECKYCSLLDLVSVPWMPVELICIYKLQNNCLVLQLFTIYYSLIKRPSQQIL